MCFNKNLEKCIYTISEAEEYEQFKVTKKVFGKAKETEDALGLQDPNFTESSTMPTATGDPLLCSFGASSVKEIEER